MSDGPIIVGLTGSIGMGKSTVAAMFADLGIPVFDADQQVRVMQGPGCSLLSEIEATFPGSTDDQGVKREALGKIVFGDAEALKKLEAIVHPAVASARRLFLLQNVDAPMVVFDIPLLFEKGGADYVDQIVVVSAPAAVQRERVLARPGMTPEKFAEILDLQMPDEDKRRRADHIIDTGVSLTETRAAVEEFVTSLIA